MKKLILILPIVLITGCCNTVFTERNADGSTISVSNARLFWTSEGYSAQFSTNGASLTASKSSSDSAAIGAIVQAAVSGAVQGAK